LDSVSQSLLDRIEVLQEGDLIFARVPSKRYSNIWHNVFYNKIDRISSCDCEGHFYNGKCHHVDELLAYLDSIHNRKI